jgi:hypothetical protein
MLLNYVTNFQNYGNVRDCHIGFEDLILVSLKSIAFWDVTEHSSVQVHICSLKTSVNFYRTVVTTTSLKIWPCFLLLNLWVDGSCMPCFVLEIRSLMRVKPTDWWWQLCMALHSTRYCPTFPCKTPTSDFSAFIVQTAWNECIMVSHI